MLHAFVLILLVCFLVLVLRNVSLTGLNPPVPQVVWWIVLVVLAAVLALAWTGAAVIVHG